MSVATEIQRIQIAKTDLNAALGRNGITIPNTAKIDSYPNYVDYNGHEYVEIGGLKWATMNIGATSVTDYGQYFQWGDTTGYYSSQVGASGNALKKQFSAVVYKFGNGNGNTSFNASGVTKYNSGDSKTVLEMCDDAARANWGGSWRLPTTEEFAALGDAVNSAWTADYQGSGVSGLVLTDKTDSSKVLFFPAVGNCYDGSVLYVGSNGTYYSSSLVSNDIPRAYTFYFNNSAIYYQNSGRRFIGYQIRAVIG